MRALSRFLAPTALSFCRDPPIPGLAYPGLVAPSRLPCASTLYSLDELPGVLPTRCAHGASPFRALPDRDRQRLSAGHPLMRLATDRSRTDIKPALFLHLPKIGSLRLAPRTDHLRLVPLGSMVRDAFGALGIAASSGLASGVSSLCRLGCTVAGFLHVRRPWLSWASSSLGHSPSEPWPQRLSRSASRPPAATPRAEPANE